MNEIENTNSSIRRCGVHFHDGHCKYWIVEVENIWDEYQNEEKYMVKANKIEELLDWAKVRKKVIKSINAIEVNGYEDWTVF